MLDACVGELLFDEAQTVLVTHAQNDGVRTRRHGARLARGMHELSTDVAQGHVRADEAVVS